MKKLITILFVLYCYSLVSQDCRGGLAIQKVRHGIHQTGLSMGNIYASGGNFKSGVVTNKNGEETVIPTFFVGGIWVSAKTSFGEAKAAGVTYKSLTDNFDFYPGPLDKNGMTDSENCTNWDRFFEIRRSDIKYTIALLFDKEGKLLMKGKCNQIPYAVRYWPAKGNPYWNEKYLFNLPMQDLASFYDYDGDGLYDPCKGDLPALTSYNCDYQNVFEVEKGFPTQMHFWVFNDNGGPHRLTAGYPLKLEIQNYFYTFEDDDENKDLSFFKFKTLYKADSDLDSFYFSIWLDPDLGCYADDYIGTASDADMVFIYNQDSLDGLNNSECGGVNTFENEIPITGISFLQGLLNAGNNTGLTSVRMFKNCAGSGANSLFGCDPNSTDQDLFNAQKNGNYGIWKQFAFNGNPGQANDSSMCSFKVEFEDMRVILNSGGVKMKPGDANEVIVATSIIRKVKYPCPDYTNLLQLNEKAKDLYENCWTTLNVIDPPVVQLKNGGDKIIMKLNNDDIGNNNIDESYNELIPGKEDKPENRYKFEGYNIYQVNSLDYPVFYLGDENSVLIKTIDLKNEIVEIYNWEEVVDSNFNSTIQKIKKVSGGNNGIPDEIIIDYDYLNNEPLKSNKEYYYVVESYAFNNFQNFDQNTDTGQKTQYISSKTNLKVYPISLEIQNRDFIPVITRIHGEGTYNSLMPNEEFHDQIFSSNYDGRITYRPGQGPFDVFVLDSNLVIGKIFELQIEGKINNSNTKCEFIQDSTYVAITDLSNSVKHYSKEPISKGNDMYFEDLGLLISLFQPSHPGDKSTSNYGYLSQTQEYAIEEGDKWFEAIKDVDEKEVGLLTVDPFKEHTTDNKLSKDKSSSFMPFYFSNFNSFEHTRSKYITPTNFQVHPALILGTSSTLKIADLNNVDIVFTADESKWSRCIVVETGDANNYGMLGLTPSVSEKMEIKKNPSIDKNGKKESTSTGFSWFPGYAVDVETGKRLNIFFGENSYLSHEESKLGNPSISDDMIFNPNNDYIYEGDDIAFGFESVLAGGHHIIYVTRQDYDGCEQLASGMKTEANISSKRDPFSSITWTCIPYLKEGTGFSSMEDGLIKNDLKIQLRVNNSFFKEKQRKDFMKFRSCNYYEDKPTYQFSFEKIISSTKEIEKNLTKLLPYKFSHNLNGIVIDDVSEDLVVEIFDIQGKRLASSLIRRNENYKWSGINQTSQMIFTKVREVKSGQIMGYKSILMK